MEEALLSKTVEGRDRNPRKEEHEKQGRGSRCKASGVGAGLRMAGALDSRDRA